MIRTVIAPLVAALILTTTAWAQQETPTSNPSEVIVKGRKVSHSWRNGRIWVATSQLGPLLNMTDEMQDMDLLQALQAKGDYLWSVVDGRFVAKQDPSQFSQTAVNTASRAQTRPNTARVRPTKSTEGIKLQYEVEEFTTEWGYKWGRVKVTNKGAQRSDVCTAYCHFQDSFGRTYAEDWWPVRSLEPGESLTFNITSGTEIENTSITPSGDNVMVMFFSQEDATKNPTSMKEARKQAKSNKKRGGIKGGPTLDFSKNGPRPPSTTSPSNPIGPADGW